MTPINLHTRWVMGGVPNALVVSINRPTPLETIIALVVILTRIIGTHETDVRIVVFPDADQSGLDDG